MPAQMKSLATRIGEALLERNRVCEAFFAREAGRLALACRDMAERFLWGGRSISLSGRCFTSSGLTRVVRGSRAH